MKDWERVIIKSDSTILQALEAIERGGIQIAFVVDQDRALNGSVSDGDIRRGLLHGVKLSDGVVEVMKGDPISARSNLSEEAVGDLMNDAGIRAVPLVDEKRQVQGVRVLEELLSQSRRQNTVLIMAGGMGTRLLPLTENCPKPLLKINGKPILEIILERLIKGGFHRFVLAVNYKAEMIRDYFQSGQKWNVDVQYIEEDTPLGTAGAISLLDELPNEPMVVINGDVITRVNAGQLIDYHVKQGADATMCVRQYEYEVPFGVVDVKGHEFLAVHEKPIKRYFVNAGVYVLGQPAMKLIPQGKSFNMTDLFEQAKQDGLLTGVYPITEYWVDIGRHDDLSRVKKEGAD